ncbi:family 16 glycosylhydrolase [Robiginitalea sp.]|nr:family 16 glycosylhydrolase [Robiginitalea sp.]
MILTRLRFFLIFTSTTLLFCCSDDNPFKETTFRISIIAGEGGAVNTNGGTFANNDSVLFTATPNSGYAFLNWSDGITDNPRTLVITSNLSLTANFVLLDTDNDGVPDLLDQCSETLEGVAVDSEGCEILPEAPLTAAPIPDKEASEVFSLFSNTYLNFPVDTFLTPWSDANLETLNLGNNLILAYSDLGFAGIETISQQINASAKTHVHFDYWTSDATQLKFKIVDFGPNGVYNGVGILDDKEHEITFEISEQGQWVSVDIPLSDFTGLTTRANLAQYIFTAEPYKETTLFIDNLFLYGTDEDSTGGGDGNSNSELELIWSDEFDYAGRPDTEKWHHQTFAPNGGSWFNGELQHYVDDAQTSYVSDGTLKIVARQRDYTSQNVTKSFTSARLNSKFAFQYGKVEVRAKLPQGEGTWPAIWTLGANINEPGNYFGDQYGSVGWPACGEIDIMEQNGWDKTRSYGYFHWSDTQTGEYRNTGTTQYIANSGEFHIYSLIWSQSSIQIAIDNQVFIEIPNDENNPYDNLHYLLLNIAIGGNLGGNVPANFGVQIMEIDYVRIYQ